MKPLRIRNARRKFTVARDSAGVPHIEAASWRTAIYGLGYMHALDRPTQMLFARAVALGRSAEHIADKPELVETDCFFRRVGLYLHLEREVGLLDDRTFGQLTAYCEGVNDGLKQSGRSLPMRATGFQAEPWNHQAVMLIGNLLSFGGLAVGQQQNERLLLELIQAGISPERLKELFQPHLDDTDFELMRKIKIASRLSDEALELITDLPRLAGSNAWAVAPARSATGAALLASDPHLEINRLPSIWYEAVLQWDGQYVMGATLPGCPLLAVARTPRVAWGVTYLKGDTIDHFIEDCRKTDDRWQFRRADGWHDFQVRTENVTRKNGPEVALEILYNDLGTLDSDPHELGAGCHLSTVWTGSLPGSGAALGTWLDIVKCADTREAMAVAKHCPQPTLVWILADADGHIGRQACGWFPRRSEVHHGLLPVPAWQAEYNWQGILSADELPSLYDPPEGFVASANENINPPGGPALVTQPVPDYRIRRIVERLEQLPQATVENMQALQYDVISLQARDLLEVFLPHLPEGEIKSRLSHWDYSYHVESLEATLFSRLYRNVLLEVFGQEPTEQGGIGWRRMLYLCSRAGFSMMVVTSIDRLLARDESTWWRKRDKGELIHRAADRLLTETDQPWSATNAFEFTNRFFESRLVGRALGMRTAQLPMPGCHATPFQGHLLRAATRETTFAPSYHFVTDMGGDRSWTNLPGGPSESWFSRWYKSDVPLWCSGRYKELAITSKP